jgi:hypothetical protein
LKETTTKRSGELGFPRPFQVATIKRKKSPTRSFKLLAPLVGTTSQQQKKKRVVEFRVTLAVLLAPYKQQQ